MKVPRHFLSTDGLPHKGPLTYLFVLSSFHMSLGHQQFFVITINLHVWLCAPKLTKPSLAIYLCIQVLPWYPFGAELLPGKLITHIPLRIKLIEIWIELIIFVPGCCFQNVGRKILRQPVLIYTCHMNMTTKKYDILIYTMIIINTGNKCLEGGGGLYAASEGVSRWNGRDTTDVMRIFISRLGGFKHRMV